MTISSSSSLPEEKFNKFLESIPERFKESGIYSLDDLRLAYIEGFENALTLIAQKDLDINIELP